MAVALDLTSDYLVFDGLESVTFTSKKAAGNVQTVISKALGRAPTYRELSVSQGVYTAQDKVWIVPKTLLDPTTPKPADFITAGSDNWTALEVKKTALGSSWWMLTRNLVLAADLRDTIDIQRAAVTYDAAGGKVRTFPAAGGTTPYQSLPAKVQKLTEALKIVLGVEGFQGTYAVIVSQELTITEDDRVKFGSLFLDIVGMKNPSRIDELPVLDCVLQP
jgi:head-tail adaptor